MSRFHPDHAAPGATACNDWSLPARRAISLPRDEGVKVERCRRAVFFIFSKGCAQRFEFQFLLLEQSKRRTHHIAGTAVTAQNRLAFDEASEMLAETE